MPENFRLRFEPTDPRLNRHVNHDPRSRLFPVRPAADTVIRTVQHKRRAPIFDQGSLGSCTGNAGVGCTATGPLGDVFAATTPKYGWDENGAIALYSDATAADDYPGAYPPTDTGSDGLTIAKVLKSAGEISGYLHAFTAEDARAALMSDALITGVTWHDDMFHPDADGRVRPTGAVAGGHEIVVAGYVVMGSAPGNDDQVWLDNSWGTGWGVRRPGQDTAGGSFWMAFGDYTELLTDNGDVTQLIPPTAPAPAPVPVPADADHVLWAAVQHWTTERHVGDNAHAVTAVKKWAKDKALA